MNARLRKVPAISYLPRSEHTHDNVGAGGRPRVIIGRGGVDMIGMRTIIGEAVASAVQRVTDVQSGTVADRGEEDLTRKILPIPVTSVPANSTVRLTIQPQELFKAKRLVVDPAVAGDFRISNAKVATRDQFSGPGAVPAAVFGPNAFDVNIDWTTCEVGELITLDITNTDTVDANIFSGCFLGTSVY